jgi:hypothetical protein
LERAFKATLFPDTSNAPVMGAPLGFLWLSFSDMSVPQEGRSNPDASGGANMVLLEARDDLLSLLRGKGGQMDDILIKPSPAKIALYFISE